MARFLLIGICQIEGIAKCLRALHPLGEVEAHTLWTLEETFENEDRLFTYMRTFDFIIIQDFGEDAFGVLSADLIREIFPRAVTLPGFLFSAFHPDIVYVANAAPKPDEHRNVQSAIGDYHSALAVFGFMQNLGLEKTLSLYRREVYEALGYMNMWSESEDFLLAAFRGYGWPVERFFVQWARRGAFMHTINHPKLFVLADIARMILSRCNVAFVDDAVEDRIIDPLLAGPTWPVYPAIAEQFGFTGSMNFKKVELDSHASLMLDLPRFVAGSFAKLERVPRENIRCARVSEWIAGGALAQFS